MNETLHHCVDLNSAIQRFEAEGYRLDMIKPADDPREALLSEPPAVAGGLTRTNERPSIRLKLNEPHGQPPAIAGGSEWTRGRAGMEYRVLLSPTLGRNVAASQIRLNCGGEVADYVHYHKIDFQVIYCLRGRIRVVYEDQGPPFWLQRGDCVLQPPEIRHRVLECEAGSEVIEISSPGDHETWVEHEMDLPTDEIKNRAYGGQHFIWSRASEAVWNPLKGTGVEVRETGVLAASGRSLNIRVYRRPSELDAAEWSAMGLFEGYDFTFPIGPGEMLVVDY